MTFHAVASRIPGRALAALLLAACARQPSGPPRQSIALEDLAELRAAIQAWAADHGGALPESLELLIRPQPGGKHYLPSGTPALHDPWGQRYQYRPGVGPDGFLIVTLGRDRAPGGSGEDADLDQSALAP
jgi:general secretion pathway protein G